MAKKITKGILLLILSINLINLLVASYKPASVGRVRITEKIHHLNSRHKLNVIFTPKNNPYSPWEITTNFYKENNAQFIPFDQIASEKIKVDKNNARNTLIVAANELSQEPVKKLISSLKMKEVCKSMPDILLPFLKLYGFQNKDVFVLYSD